MLARRAGTTRRTGRTRTNARARSRRHGSCSSRCSTAAHCRPCTCSRHVRRCLEPSSIPFLGPRPSRREDARTAARHTTALPVPAGLHARGCGPLPSGDGRPQPIPATPQHAALTTIARAEQRLTFSLPKDAGSRAHQYLTELAADRRQALVGRRGDYGDELGSRGSNRSTHWARQAGGSQGSPK